MLNIPTSRYDDTLPRDDEAAVPVSTTAEPGRPHAAGSGLSDRAANWLYLLLLPDAWCAPERSLELMSALAAQVVQMEHLGRCAVLPFNSQTPGRGRCLTPVPADHERALVVGLVEGQSGRESIPCWIVEGPNCIRTGQFQSFKPRGLPALFASFAHALDEWRTQRPCQPSPDPVFWREQGAELKRRLVDDLMTRPLACERLMTDFPLMRRALPQRLARSSMRTAEAPDNGEDRAPDGAALQRR